MCSINRNRCSINRNNEQSENQKQQKMKQGERKSRRLNILGRGEADKTDGSRNGIILLLIKLAIHYTFNGQSSKEVKLIISKLFVICNHTSWLFKFS